ncbi:MAG: hypothetical protein GWN58_21460, partial [Anaerolineae bacterium]|nr:hypothetical protein [Anaerolineae bacterium]
ALLFQKDAVVLVQVERGARGGNHRLSHVSRLELAEGSIQPSLSEVNFRSPAETSARIGRLLDQMPQRKKLARISLVLPDACARVFLLDMQELPRSRRQAEHMIKWQVRKRVPFNLDDARMAVQRFPLPEGGERIAVVLGVERVLSQYEQIVTALGLRPGLLDLATFNMANLLFLDGNETASVDEQD